MINRTRTGTRLLSFALALIIATVFLITGCTQIENSLSIRNTSAESFAICSEEMAIWCKNSNTVEEICANQRPYFNKGTLYYPVDPILTWQTSFKAEFYEVLVSKDCNFPLNDTYRIVTSGSQASVPYQILDTGRTYYWRVIAYNIYETAENSNISPEITTVRSMVFNFTTEDTPRTVNMPGITNSRDLGGVISAGGARIKSGLVYRSYNLDGVSNTKYIAECFGIKTDLDLRSDGEGTAGTGTPLGKNVQYVHISAPLYQNIFADEWKDALKEEIEIFADEANYPVIFHCAIGRDRTGTLAMLLEALCGADEFHIYRDYIATLFSAPSCTASITADAMLPNIKDTVEALKSYAKNEGLKNPTINEAVELFLTRKIGISDENIAKIRNILSETD